MIETKENTKTEKFRDTLGIVSNEGKRKWMFPKKPEGKFYNARTIVSIILLGFFFGMPFIKINGNPFFLFNILERKFILFGQVFGPQDFFIFLIAMVSAVVFLFLFTAVYGRIFCGWICPQTIFLEMVFRRIEYWIEGDSAQQRALKLAPWNRKKIFKKVSKQLIFLSISFLIANMFLAWIIGIDKLKMLVTDSPSNHLSAFIAVVAFTGVFYWIFSWFREQACILVCPYGRLQGVLLDQDSLVIAYDHVRGEPRGKLIAENTGDCIDCRKCVAVCPTGIDIRNGTQIECVNCTACIDACDDIMIKVNKPKGLIRYASMKGILEGKKFKVTPRILSYSLLLLVLLSGLTYAVLTRTAIDVNILRTPGLLSQEQPGNKISNVYDLKINNKTFEEKNIELKVKGIPAEVKVLGENLQAGSQEIVETKIMLILPKEELQGTLTTIDLEIFANGELIKEVDTSFLGKVQN